MPNLSSRIEKLEQSAGIGNHPAGPIILMIDIHNEGADITIDRWKAENGEPPKNAFFIVLVSL